MSNKRSTSEKRRAAEKHGKPSGSASKPLPASSAAEAVAPAPGQQINAAPKPSPGAQASEEFVSNLLRSVQATGQVIAKIVEDKDKRQGAFTVASGMADSGKLFAPIIQYWMNDPKAYAEAQAKLSEDMIDLWGRTYKRFLGEKVEPVIASSGNDPRFSDKEWTENAFFDFLKQAYLLAGKWAEGMIHNAATVDAHTKHRAEFYLNQIVSALSPSNFPFTNPEVIRATVSTGAKNLAQGMTHLLEDLDHSGELLRIRQTDMSAFEVGKNLAVTPGKVVYQNDLLQLIQYSPTTETVHKVPMLIVPPWINKFYILDLTPPKSFIKWIVDQGFTVFVISWVNPDERLASKTFEDYMLEGVVAGVDAVLRVTGQPHTNTLGYCVGGTLLACTLAYMAAKDDHRINSATL
ncbi:MAG TPA: class I poly(R)-hydroxyalkanoic acid synthase, partial [Rhodomicrobium sp.]|nr:class I poly(R)-hydroxyalkanoic acid synthase [Rhodomicrobium sp.]